MNLTVDQGNTYTKIAIFEGETLAQAINNVPNEEVVKQINAILPNNCIFSSVRKNEGIDFNTIDPRIKYYVFDHQTPLPIQNLYETPATLGTDRIAGVIGSRYFQHHGSNLVIDCGTCITYDLIDADDHYQGGSISPGIDMRFKALHNFTASLPLISLEDRVDLIGNTTKSAILSGVVNGTICEMEGIIEHYRQLYVGLSVFLCGGGAKYFESKIRGTIFVTPELVLYGLNKILQYNVKNI